MEYVNHKNTKCVRNANGPIGRTLVSSPGRPESGRLIYLDKYKLQMISFRTV